MSKPATALPEDILGAMYELNQFAGLDPDVEADPDFKQLPAAVQMAIQTLGAYQAGVSFDKAGEVTAPTSTGTQGAVKTAAVAAVPGAHFTPHPYTVMKAEEVKGMSNTKEDIWAEIQRQALEASKVPTADAAGVQQAVAEFLSTTAGGKLYDAWVKAPWATQSGATAVAKSERRVVGEDIMDGAAKRLQKSEPGLSYEQAYAKALDSDPIAQLAYTAGNHHKPSGTSG